MINKLDRVDSWIASIKCSGALLVTNLKRSNSVLKIAYTVPSANSEYKTNIKAASFMCTQHHNT